MSSLLKGLKLTKSTVCDLHTANAVTLLSFLVYIYFGSAMD